MLSWGEEKKMNNHIHIETIKGRNIGDDVDSKEEV